MRQLDLHLLKHPLKLVYLKLVALVNINLSEEGIEPFAGFLQG
jgi:hypothetical protein